MRESVAESIHLKTLNEDDVPMMVTESPGPESLAIWDRERPYISPGLSGSTLTSRLVLDEGYMTYLKDVDGNVYIDFREDA